jgi:DNA-binding MarR family transcriptional regulator
MNKIVSNPSPGVTDLLYRLEQHRRALVAQVLAPHHLSLTQWWALKTLWTKGACSMTTLAQISGIDRTSLTRTVDSLIARGWVSRSTPPSDRRAVIVQASREGVKLVRQAVADVDTVERQMLATLDAERLAALARDLGRLVGSLTLAGPQDHCGSSLA